MNTPLDFATEVNCRLLWRLGSMEDRSWLASQVPESIRDGWGLMRTKVPRNAERVPVTREDVRAGIRILVASLKAKGQVGWSGTPDAFADLLATTTGVRLPGNVRSFLGTVGLVLGQWAEQDPTPLVFTRQIGLRDGSKRTWSLSF